MVNVIDNRLKGLQQAISDVYYTSQGCLFRANYYDLTIELTELVGKDALLPKTYQTNVLRPFIDFLTNMGEAEFNRIFSEDDAQLASKDRSLKKVIEEVAEALLQRNHQDRYYESSFKDLLALQAVITTIYDDILNSEISQLARKTIAPLAKWGHRKSPYTLPIVLTNKVGVKAGIVSLPIENRNGGLLAWASLGHEVGGHNILHAHPDLIPQLQAAVHNAILTAQIDNVSPDMRNKMADYWRACTEEVASDQLGLLNIGPSFGIAMLGYFRGVRGKKLNSTGPLHGEGSSKKSLRLFFDDGSTDIIVEKTSDSIDLKNNEGVVGFNSQNHPLKYQKIFFHRGKHPVDVLRPLALSRGIAVIEDALVGQLC